jgi:predicted CXXCH cytochrome family protein
MLRFLTRNVGLLLLAVAPALAQDVLGTHDLSPAGQSPIKGNISNACLYCHAPHSGQDLKLWNQKLSVTPYTPYSSTTVHQTPQNKRLAPLGTDSSMCLSCHDGTVAPGTTTAYGKMSMTGSMQAKDKFRENTERALQSSHPFSLDLPLQDAPDLVKTLKTPGITKAPDTIKLKNGNIECTTCHNPHVQAADTQVQKFLVQDSSAGKMCLACHDPTRSDTGQVNPLSGWNTTAIHATAENKTHNPNNAYVGGYGTVADNSCNSCHAPHDASGQARLLRGTNEEACRSCHSGLPNMTPLAPNIFAEEAKAAQTNGSGHPFSTPTGSHERTEAAVLNLNRHATCVDCHNSHAAAKTQAFSGPPGIRDSQDAVSGVDVNGTTVLAPATDQYQNCLRCHGTSTGKPATSPSGYLPARLVTAPDPFNVIPEFLSTSTSSHPVFHNPSSPLPQPSLRTGGMLNLGGAVNSARPLTGRIFCTDCHSSDDSREFGGKGPAGPHGSIYPHILERQYLMSQVASGAPAGTTIANVQLAPDLGPRGTYALCAKCHNLYQVVSKTSSFSAEHQRHVVKDGLSCSACHTAHGMGNTSANVTGERMVNFDINVVSGNVLNGAVTPISYDRNAATLSATCTLTCHNYTHNPSGSKPGMLKSK